MIRPSTLYLIVVMLFSARFANVQAINGEVSTTAADTAAPRNGKTGPALFRPSTGNWYILSSSITQPVCQWGGSAGAPVAGDYDGDGKTDPAVYIPSVGQWWLLYSSTGYTTNSGPVSWGSGGDSPVRGDYDGDGKTDPAVYRPSTGQWFILKSSTTYTTSIVVSWGLSTDTPINKRP